MFALVIVLEICCSAAASDLQTVLVCAASVELIPHTLETTRRPTACQCPNISFVLVEIAMHQYDYAISDYLLERRIDAARIDRGRQLSGREFKSFLRSIDALFSMARLSFHKQFT